VAWTSGRRGQQNLDLWVTDLHGTAPPRLALRDMNAISALDVSSDRRFVLVGQRISLSVARRFILDLTDGSLRRLLPTAETEFRGGIFTADDRAVLTLSNLGEEHSRLVRIDIATDSASVMSMGRNWDVEQADVSADGKLLAYSTNEDGVSRVEVRKLADGKRLQVPPLPNGVVDTLAFSPDSTLLAIGLSTPATPRDVWSWSVGARTLTRWTSSGLGGLTTLPLVEPKGIRVPTSDGRTVPAFVYSPASDEPKRPVIIVIHGGPASQERPDFFLTYQFWMAELGATVLAPNVRGSTGYGRSYADADNGFRREDVLHDVEALLNWIARQPDLDPQRVVVYGGSAAGLVVLGSLAHFPERIAGGVSIAGISDLPTFLETTDASRREVARAEYGDERDPQMRAFQSRISPLNLASRIRSPLLIVHGANDARVPKSQADQIVAAVRANGEDVWYLWAKDEGHGFSKSSNQQAQRLIEIAFFRRIFAGLHR
jgi:dipeptidyl aminopeptidase/acylaminoacyl peptidase